MSKLAAEMMEGVNAVFIGANVSTVLFITGRATALLDCWLWSQLHPGNGKSQLPSISIGFKIRFSDTNCRQSARLRKVFLASQAGIAAT